MSETMILGTDIDTKLPVKEPVERLTRINSLAFGRTQSGKSTLWLFLILFRLMTIKAPLIIFDGARWKFLYHAVRQMAAAAGREVKVLFDTHRYQGNRLDPLHPFRKFDPSAKDLGSYFFNASGVPYSRAYGVGFFGLMSMEAAVDAAAAIISSGRPLTISAILEKLMEITRRSPVADQIRASLKMIALHEALQHEDDGSADYVRWDEVDEKNQVVLVHWKIEDPSSSFFASSIHQSLVAHAHLADEMGLPPVRRVIAMDEFQALVGPGFAMHLSQELKFGLSHHLLGQSHFQLEAVDPALAKVVIDQADWQMHFTVDPFTVEYLQSFSKEIEGSLKNRTLSSYGFSVGNREVKEKALSLNDILEVSSRFGMGLLIRKTQPSFSEPVKLHMDHVINEETFHHLNSLPFPVRPAPPAPSSPAAPPSPSEPRDEAWERAALEIYQRRRAWESGE